MSIFRYTHARKGLSFPKNVQPFTSFYRRKLYGNLLHVEYYTACCMDSDIYMVIINPCMHVWVHGTK
jgi:hypothetical protein